LRLIGEELFRDQMFIGRCAHPALQIMVVFIELRTINNIEALIVII
jgi:hypothetical protein